MLAGMVVMALAGLLKKSPTDYNSPISTQVKQTLPAYFQHLNLGYGPQHLRGEQYSALAMSPQYRQHCLLYLQYMI